MRRLLRALAAFLLVCGSLLLAFGAPAGAADVADAGWWYVRPGFTGQPPGVPEDGLYVAGTPDGAVSIAAVRFTLGESETDPKLTLTVASQSPQGDDGGGGEGPLPVPGGAPVPAPAAPTSDAAPVILACHSGSGWTGEQAGSADAAPKVACSEGSVPGERAADGGSWTWDVADLVVDGTIDVILVAGKVDELPEGANGSTFQVAFERPASDAIESLEGLEPVPFEGGGDDFGAGADFGAGEGGDAGFAGDTGGGGADFGTDGGGSFDDAGLGTTEPALPEEQQGLTSTAPLVQAQSPAPEVAAAESAGSSSDARVLGFVVLLAAAGVAVAAGRQTAPPLHGLGPFRREVAGAAVPATAARGTASGGLGRFARSRSGPAPKL